MTASSENYYNFKVVLLGEGCVGKTSLILRYVEGTFNPKHVTTLQVFVIILIFLEIFKQRYQYFNVTFFFSNLLELCFLSFIINAFTCINYL